MNEISDIFKTQSTNRWNVSRSNGNERVAKLKKLKAEILKRREDIKAALFLEFKKPYAESELTEIHPVLDEINFAIKNLKYWMKPRTVSTPIVLFGAKSKIYYEARGVVLILSPWNYPFSLLINPLVSAISAGNCVLARPSEKTPYIAKVLKEIIEEIFSPSEIAIVLGEVDVAEKLLELPFDHIFFTGSIAVGKKVMAAAAKHLSSVTLELGGKSPVIIDRNYDLEIAAKRIAWGKFINGGQTCVAPDYLFIPFELKDEFLKIFTKQIKINYGATSLERLKNPDYARLINVESLNRLIKKIEGETSCLSDEPLIEQNYLPPTLIETRIGSPILEDEIFGPILPVLTYKNIDEVISYIRSGSKPLALYIFSNNKQFIKNILESTSSGGALVNHVVVHLANPNLPFGGVGHSGQGSCHGHFGFKAFSHEKSVLHQGRFTLTSLYFPPYSTWLSKVSFKILRLFE